MLFKVVTAGKTPAVIKQLSSSGTLVSRTITITSDTVLDVYGYANSEETRFVVWNEQLSASFFTVSINDCRPMQVD
jgi:dihydroxyacid dehydratase/phosphogluconate dehydratase